ncbi:MAG: hydrogenase maturation nickel metallochaperone HypA [Desulfosalsimonas sp.]
MHELPVTENILNIVLKHAEKNQVARVVSITLHVGELSDLEEQWIQHYFDYLSKNTPAGGAKLKIEWLPIVLKCRGCNQTVQISKDQLGATKCPGCGAEGDFSLVSGRQYYIKEMEAV